MFKQNILNWKLFKPKRSLIEHVFKVMKGTFSLDKIHIKALGCLKEHGIRHSIGFALCKLNFHCIDHIIALCKKYECNVLNFGMYQTFKKSDKTVRFTEWLKAKEYVSKYVKTHVKCVETGCVAGICGIAVTSDLYYWDCPRHQEIMGKYPQPIRDVLRDEENNRVHRLDRSWRYLQEEEGEVTDSRV